MASQLLSAAEEDYQPNAEAVYNSYQLNDNNATKRDPSRASSSVDNVVEMVAKGEPLDEAEEELLGNWSLEEKQILLRSLKTNHVDYNRIQQRLPSKKIPEIKLYLNNLCPGSACELSESEDDGDVNDENELRNEQLERIKRYQRVIRKSIKGKTDRSKSLKDIFRRLAGDAAQNGEKHKVQMKAKVYVVDYSRLYAYITALLTGEKTPKFLSAVESALLLEVLKRIDEEAKSASCVEQRDYLETEVPNALADIQQYSQVDNSEYSTSIVKTEPPEEPAAEKIVKLDISTLNPLAIPRDLLQPSLDI